ncbi:MAG: FAD-binding oxidoreductase [Acidobacteriota bacterium]|jgi:4-cresol dehydrogenase (hydroxylating)
MTTIDTLPLDSFRSLLGPEAVVVDREALDRAETATFSTSQAVPVILRPADRDQVAGCLRIAHEHHLPVYPVSRGKNWGLGSSVPAADGCALLDLGRLDRILDFDEELGCVTVEPGVTFRRLAAFLEDRGSELMVSQTGSTPDSSLVGNAVERGTGRGYPEDRFGSVGGLEVVLPTGEVLRTGFDRFPGARTGGLHPWGVGPWLDGLFTQSNLGVVTRMTLWLTPRPACFQPFFFRLGGKLGFAESIDRLRALRWHGPRRAVFSLYNDYRMLSMMRQYPWEESGGETPLSQALRARLRREYRVGPWNGSGALYSAGRRQGRADRRLLRRFLGPCADRLLVLDPLRARLLKGAERIYRRVRGERGTPLADRSYYRNPLIGFSHDEGGTPLTYWRKRETRPERPDPDADGCGTIWFNPVVPWRGREVAAAVETVERISLAAGFEPNLGLRFISDRCVDVTGAIVYDREIPGEDERAMAAHDEILDALAGLGYLPSRLGIHSMGFPGVRETVYDGLLGRLKETLDPHGILAPRRYDSSLPSAPGE